MTRALITLIEMDRPNINHVEALLDSVVAVVVMLVEHRDLGGTNLRGLFPNLKLYSMRTNIRGLRHQDKMFSLKRVIYPVKNHGPVTPVPVLHHRPPRVSQLRIQPQVEV